MSNALPDPSRLEFGVATASYQIEGAPDADGRTPSIWDTLTRVPGAIDDGSDGSVACASYPDPGPDIDLVAGLGVRWYRFSVAWPRIMPDGGTEVCKQGLDYYERLVDGLLERGVTPMATLYHWDLPQSLEDRGGWLVRETPERFADYAIAVHDRLGDRVRLWATLNEPWCSAYLGYASGRHAPGKQVGSEAHRAAHHLLLGHGLASARLHEGGADSVGIVLNLTPGAARQPGRRPGRRRSRRDPQPPVAGAPRRRRVRRRHPARRSRARGPGPGACRRPGPRARVRRLARRQLLHPRAGGRGHRRRARATDTGGDSDVAAFPGVGDFRFAPRHPRTDIDWEIDADSLERLLVDTHERTGLPLMVTENGAACADTTLLPDGSVDDADRIEYLSAHLAAIDAARRHGADVRGWLVWTLMDNFEWSHGYTMTFGLVSVDRSTLVRTPKRSYHWFADLIRRRTT